MNSAPALLLALSLSTAAAVPSVMNHQGRIAVSGANYDGTGYFKFALVDASGTTTHWTNDGTASGEPATSVTVSVAKGHYASLLGETPMVALPGTVFASEDDVRLRVWFSTDDSTFTQLSPDRRITPAGYALAADVARSIAPGYETGGGADLSLESIGGSGELVLTASYGQTFAGAPGVAFGQGWAVTGGDTDGFTAEASLAHTTIDSRGATGSYPSLAIIAGRPAIAYRSDSEGDLMFVRAKRSTGSSWPDETTIDRVDGSGVSDVGEYASLAEVNGHPAIAYYNATDGDLKYLRADDPEGASWPTPILVDGASANVGRHCSLAVVGGVPAISYTSPNTGGLLYVEALDADGTAWGTPLVVEGTIADYRLFSSLAEVGGEPAIATYDNTANTLRYARRNGGAWTGATLGAASSFSSPGLAVIAGHPAIAYGAPSGNIAYVRSNDVTGTNWPSASAVGPGVRPSLADAGGRPAIVFYGGGLQFAIGADTAGGSWASTPVGAPFGSGFHNALALVDGLPAIAYWDESSDDLDFASLPPASWSATLGDPAPILASGVKPGAVTEAMLAEDFAATLAARDEEIARLKQRLADLETAVFGAPRE